MKSDEEQPELGKRFGATPFAMETAPQATKIPTKEKVTIPKITGFTKTQGAIFFKQTPF